MSRRDSGPAFPVKEHLLGTRLIPSSDGMSLRDYFAAAALQGLLATGDIIPGGKTIGEDMASAAYGYADALLVERDRTDFTPPDVRAAPAKR